MKIDKKLITVLNKFRSQKHSQEIMRKIACDGKYLIARNLYSYIRVEVEGVPEGLYEFNDVKANNFNAPIDGIDGYPIPETTETTEYSKEVFDAMVKALPFCRESVSGTTMAIEDVVWRKNIVAATNAHTLFITEISGDPYRTVRIPKEFLQTIKSLKVNTVHLNKSIIEFRGEGFIAGTRYEEDYPNINQLIYKDFDCKVDIPKTLKSNKQYIWFEANGDVIVGDYDNKETIIKGNKVSHNKSISFPLEEIAKITKVGADSLKFSGRSNYPAAFWRDEKNYVVLAGKFD